MPLRARLATRNGALAVAVIAGRARRDPRVRGDQLRAQGRHRGHRLADRARRQPADPEGQLRPGDRDASTCSASRRVSEQALVAGAVTDISQLRDKVATQDIYPGQQISADDVRRRQRRADARSWPQTIARSRSRSTRRTASSARSQPGDHVDVLAGFNVQSDDRRPAPGDAGSRRQRLGPEGRRSARRGHRLGHADVTLRVSADDGDEARVRGRQRQGLARAAAGGGRQGRPARTSSRVELAALRRQAGLQGSE